MNISVIIPVYNNLILTKNCVKSIACSSFYFNELEVIIVDDNSEDGTSDYFTRFSKENKWLTYHRNNTNLKFAGSCNQGAALARGEFIIFLNNDTVVSENWDKILADTLEQDKDIWMAGAKLVYPDMTLQHAGVYLPEIRGKSFGHVYRGFPSYFPPAGLEKDLQCVTAACIIMRREEFHRLGGFDESFRNGSEDIDLCLKVIHNGKRILYQPRCEIIHFESKSEGRYEHSKQNAELLYQKWKEKVRPDMVERIDQDFRICNDSGSMLQIGHYTDNTGLPEIFKDNHNLEFNSRNIPGDDLVLKIACISEKRNNLALQYGTRSGYQDEKTLKSVQPVYEGENRLVYNVKPKFLPDLLTFSLEESDSALEIHSVSFYAYSRQPSGGRPKLSLLYHPESGREVIDDLAQKITKAGLEEEVIIKTVGESWNSASINAAIASTNADYILLLDKEMTVNADFPVHAVEIMELQPRIGFIYSHVKWHQGKSSTLVRHDLQPENILSKGKTDMAGIFRKRCWEVMGGYDESVRCFRNTDLFLGIVSSGNWRGYRIKYPACEIHDKKELFPFDCILERRRIKAKHKRFLQKKHG